jgi:hypothetical protein
MSTRRPFNFKQWIDDNRHLLKPPVGNKVVFETCNSYIQDRTRTIKTPIEERNGAYVFDIWRPKATGNQSNMVNTGRYQALMEVEDNVTKGFSRQAGLR